MDQPTMDLTGYLNNYNTLLDHLNGNNDGRRIAVRDQAFSFFKENGFPSTKQESWRFTDVSPIAAKKFIHSLEPDENLVRESEINTYLYPDWDGIQLVFIDGQFSHRFSAIPKNLDQKIKITNLRSLPKTQQKLLTEILEKSSAKNDNAFTALNTAFFSDGIWIELADNVGSELSVHLVHIASGRQENIAYFPRNVINIGKNSSINLTETFQSPGNSLYFCNIVTDINIAENAKMDHIKIQAESLSAFHVSHTYINQEKQSAYKSCVFSSGSALARNSINAIVYGEACETELDGLYLGHGSQLIDNNTHIDHAKPHCHSREIYRGILADKSRGVFSGKIMVHPDAQKTDAKQSNNCLLLSEEAKINSKPQLEIYADDVKCTHGATVGQLDEEALFYLRSRGIARNTARNILIYAFAEEIIENIADDKTKNSIENLILNRLNKDMNFNKE
ncbi:MAG: Fe-S cluster assembly protein SufD [Calditrichaceae bacterium]|nr:Fe-S cluster assembly protein SufD [Calditrichaceae bacterium]MBN2709854.1 Fe-S cluster assembly protein SufD [Calditrichaceae bacterium]RQV94200.1 MAG: Fe-S cluster assembly protein SufD [Calditrichota bacterium]